MEEKSNHKSLFMIIILLLVVLLAAIAVAVVFIVRSNQDAIKNAANGQQEYTQGVVTITPADITPINLKDAISTNLLRSPDGSEHAIRLSVGVGVSDLDKKASAALITLLTDKEVIWRDVVLGLVRDNTKEDLEAPGGREQLKNDIKQKLSALYDTNLIVEVYVSDMIFQ